MKKVNKIIKNLIYREQLLMKKKLDLTKKKRSVSWMRGHWPYFFFQYNSIVNRLNIINIYNFSPLTFCVPKKKKNVTKFF